MIESRIIPGWPPRRVSLTLGGVDLDLEVPENPYGLLDLPAVEEASRENDYMPYWAHLWPAGMMLGQWLVEQVKAWLEYRRSKTPAPQSSLPPPPAAVLEIGCGLGTAGLLAARLGYRVTLTDYDPDALDYVQRNARLNKLNISTTQLDWRRHPGDRYPIILAADVLYEQRNHEPIFELLRLSLEASGVAVLDPGRHMADLFVLDAPRAGWQVEVQPVRWEVATGRVILLQKNL